MPLESGCSASRDNKFREKYMGFSRDDVITKRKLY